MVIRTLPTALISILIIPQPLQAASTDLHKHASVYAGQEQRQIKSLSESDIAQLKAGAGWGLAKAAELNGVPGPLHLLEMKEQIGLSNSQIEAIEALYQEMKQEAITLGERLIDQEKSLEKHFREHIPTTDKLREMLNEIGKTRAALRYAHLSAHLNTPNILTRK